MNWQLLFVQTLIALVGGTLALGTLVAIVNYFIGSRAVRLLVNKYLFRRRLAWVSLLAVALCTALVLVVFSVMGGWLQKYRTTFKMLSGDIIVSSPRQVGFGGYEEMIKRIEALSGVQAAVPVIRSAGLINIDNKLDSYVQVVGIPADQIDRVWDFASTLTYKENGKYPQPIPTGKTSFKLYDFVPYEFVMPNDPKVRERPGMIVGSQIVYARKEKDGKISWPSQLELRFARLTVVPGADDLSSSTSISATTTQYWIVQGSRTQLPIHDNNVYVPFDVLQRDLQMTAYEYTNRLTGKKEIEPARTSEIQVKLKPDAVVNDVKAEIEQIVFDISGQTPNSGFGSLRVQTWQQQQQLWLGAIENEIALTTFLFGLISLVAVALIFCIFYMIVIEKTRDIGILKSVGASAWNVGHIFLCYGATIGFVGGLAGVALGWLVVSNINPLHRWVAGKLGFDIWNSNVYAFDDIPSKLSSDAAVITFAVAIAAAVAGAGVPALRASLLKPVAALRFE